ncbi:hypothetical protein FB451DRAFT_1185513 [Mycena latifolia]|nr:hypothetical protein FB451DRAFT_1185513 [Mycena latifolia]
MNYELGRGNFNLCYCKAGGYLHPKAADPESFPSVFDSRASGCVNSVYTGAEKLRIHICMKFDVESKRSVKQLQTKDRGLGDRFKEVMKLGSTADEISGYRTENGGINPSLRFRKNTSRLVPGRNVGEICLCSVCHACRSAYPGAAASQRPDGFAAAVSIQGRNEKEERDNLGRTMYEPGTLTYEVNVIQYTEIPRPMCGLLIREETGVIHGWINDAVLLMRPGVSGRSLFVAGSRPGSSEGAEDASSPVAHRRIEAADRSKRHSKERGLGEYIFIKGVGVGLSGGVVCMYYSIPGDEDVRGDSERPRSREKIEHVSLSPLPLHSFGAGSRQASFEGARARGVREDRTRLVGASAPDRGKRHSEERGLGERAFPKNAVSRMEAEEECVLLNWRGAVAGGIALTASSPIEGGVIMRISMEKEGARVRGLGLGGALCIVYVSLTWG